MNYSQKMKELRIKKELTQADIANILGIERITYTHYETQEKLIPVERLNDLCNYYNVSIDYILNLTDKIQYQNNLKDINKELSSIRLKEFRKNNKLTQAKLAEKLNVSRTTITEYERGTNIIATPFLYTICKKYHISADYLLGKTNNSMI